MSTPGIEAGSHKSVLNHREQVLACKLSWPLPFCHDSSVPDAHRCAGAAWNAHTSEQQGAVLDRSWMSTFRKKVPHLGLRLLGLGLGLGLWASHARTEKLERLECLGDIAPSKPSMTV